MSSWEFQFAGGGGVILFYLFSFFFLDFLDTFISTLSNKFSPNCKQNQLEFVLRTDFESTLTWIGQALK